MPVGASGCFLQPCRRTEPQGAAPGLCEYTSWNAKDSYMDLIRILIAILLPPLGVFLQVGFGGAFWLNILLTLLGYIPGIVHAVYIIAKR
tara:strand:- start:7836 stop:8105 length:270 start_codon:yes stop_codon:yes gene_type:complete